jgi:hypothetical protein
MPRSTYAGYRIRIHRWSIRLISHGRRYCCRCRDHGRSMNVVVPPLQQESGLLSWALHSFDQDIMAN